MQTAFRYLDHLTEAVALKADGHLIAELANKVRVEITIKDQRIEWLTDEVKRLSSEQKH